LSRSSSSASVIDSSCDTSPSSSMSSEPTIVCEGVGKAFQLYMHRNDQLKQTLFGRWHQFYKQHWVLKDVSFQVAKGECVGIVGRNGAGKSTLLQILCGITTQTHGTTRINGRLAPAARMP
jgi:lipopolysaccharide transport system ATP-binding protein